MTLQQDVERNEAKHLHTFADFKGKRILEIGCGEGRLTWQYANQARSVIGLDLDPDALRVASVDRSSDLQSKVLFVCADSTRIPFQKEQFDLAMFAWSF